MSHSFHNRKNKSNMTVLAEMNRINASRFRQRQAPRGNTLQSQINRLERKVAQNTNEVITFKDGDNIFPSSTAFEQTTLSVTDDLHASANFRDDVTGEKWRNHWLDLRYVGPNDMSTLRVMIYVPKKPGTSFVPPARKGVYQPDNNAFWVLYDKSHDLVTNTESHKHARVNLRKLVSEYASSGSTLERGDIKITFIYAGSTSNISYNYQLGFSNV
ncbi:MAG: hypothetical protein [Circular genetic element sp.]|nr:MAG: hypothetical protein [Circular genetic element sp.]